MVAIDASSPSAATASPGPTATTGSFTPPANSLLYIEFSGNTTAGANPSTPTITDNLGTHLTYTLLDRHSHADSPTRDGQVATWSAPIVTSAAMTVSVTNTDAGNQHGALKIYVLTDQSGRPVIGAHGHAGSASASSISQLYSAQATGSQGFLVVCDWDLIGAETAGASNTMDASANVGTAFTYAFDRRTTADGVSDSSTTLAVTVPGTSANISWAYTEIMSPLGDPSLPQRIPPFLLQSLIARYHQLYANDDGTAATPDQNVSVNGISTAETLGSPTITTTVTVAPNGITTSEQLGNASIAVVINSNGIPTAETLGSPTITTTYTISSSGIPTRETFGAISTTMTINPNGITTSEVFGLPSVAVITSINAASISTGERLGLPSITLNVTPGGISTNENLGNPNVATASSITPNGIVSDASVGSPTVATTVTITPNGISTSERLGNANVATVTTITPGGITTSEQLGSPSIAVIVAINAAGIPTLEQLGSPTVTSTYTISANGIRSGELFGGPTVGTASSIFPAGIPTSERLGAATVTPGAVTVTAHGIPSGERLGNPLTTNGIPSILILAGSISSSEFIGWFYVGPPASIDVVSSSEEIEIEISATDNVTAMVVSDSVVSIWPADALVSRIGNDIDVVLHRED